MRKQNEVIVEMDKQTEKTSEVMWHEKNNFNQYVASDSRDLPGTGYLSSVRDFYGKSGNLQLRGTSARREGWLCYLAFASAVSDVAKCCGAADGFAGIFSDVLELDALYRGDSGGAACVRYACGVGTCEISVSRKENGIWTFYSCDDDAVSGDDAVPVSGAESAESAGFAWGSDIAGHFFYVLCVHHVPFFSWAAGECDGGGAGGRCGGASHFYLHRYSAWEPGNFVCNGLFISGLLQHAGTADDFLKNEESLAAVAVSAGDHGTECGICVLRIACDGVAGTVCVSGGAGLSGAGHCGWGE